MLKNALNLNKVRAWIKTNVNSTDVIITNVIRKMALEQMSL